MTAKGLKITAYMVLLVLCIALFVGLSFQGSYGYINHDIKDVSFTGQYSLDGVVYNDIHKVKNLPDLQDITMYIKGSFSEDIPADSTVCFKIKDYSIWVSQHGEDFTVIYDCGDLEGKLAFTEQWVTFNSAGLKAGEEVIFRIHGSELSSQIAPMISSMCYGSATALFERQVRSNIVSFSASIILMFIGIAFIVSVFILRATKKAFSLAFLHCGVFILVAGFSTILDYDYITLFTKNLPILNVLDFYTQIVLCIVMMLYCLEFLHTKWKRTLFIYFISLYLIGCMAYPFLEYYHIFSMSDFTSLYPYVMAVFYIVYFIMAIGEYVKLRDLNILLHMISIFILAVSLVIEFFRYFSTGAFFIFVQQFATLLFSFIQIVIVVKTAKQGFILEKSVEAAKQEEHQKIVDNTLEFIQPIVLADTSKNIIQLFYSNPEDAVVLLDNYNRYLSLTISCLKETKLVDFEQEFVYAQSYLNLAKAELREHFDFSFDIQTDNFKLPTLTLVCLLKGSLDALFANPEANCSVCIATRESASTKALIITSTVRGEIMNPDYDKVCRTDEKIAYVKDNLKKLCNADISVLKGDSMNTVYTITFRT